MIVSDHQPFLFGHAGIIEKIKLADLHVVIADINYRPEDKLGRLMSADVVLQPQIHVDDNDRRICNAVLTNAGKFKRSLEQSLLSRKCLYRDRFADAVLGLYEGMGFMEMWWAFNLPLFDLFDITDTKVIVSTDPVESSTTFGRNIARLDRYVAERRVKEYICGPAVRSYYDDAVAFDPHKVVVVQSIAPDPTSMVWKAAREAWPRLGDFSFQSLYGEAA